MSPDSCCRADCLLWVTQCHSVCEKRLRWVRRADHTGAGFFVSRQRILCNFLYFSRKYFSAISAIKLSFFFIFSLTVTMTLSIKNVLANSKSDATKQSN